MDSKRLIIAVIASIIVVMSWNYIAFKLGWIEEPAPGQVMEEKTQEISPPPLPASISSEQFNNLTSSESVLIETPLYKAKIAVNGGSLQSFTLKRYFAIAGSEKPFQFFSPNAAQYAPLGILIDGRPTWGKGTWKASESNLIVQNGEEKVLTLEAEIEGIKLRRELLFTASSYTIQERTFVYSDETKNIQIAYSLDATQLSENEKYNITKVAWNEAGAIETEDNRKDLAQGQEVTGNIQWAGIMDNYFLTAIAPLDSSSLTMRAKYEGDIFRVALFTTPVLASRTTPAFTSTHYYIGPKDSSLLDKAPNNLKESITYGFFAFLARPLILFLEFINSFVHNYGIAIIILTFAIKLLFWPLSQKSFASMNKMKQMQPLVEELREKYKDNKEEMNKAIMNLYKTYKVNPMGGCLPLLVQIPVFFALYEALLNSLSLRHAMFIEYLPFTNIIWLADLSEKDPLYITPIAMGISMFVQQLLTPSTGDAMQRKIMLMMPLVFTVFFLNFPAGLVLYWLSSNIISIIQQWLLTRKTTHIQGGS